MDTKVNFNVKALGFPKGKIYKMHLWINGYVENAGKYVDRNADKIKEELKDVCVVHSIEFTHTTYTNVSHDGEDYGDLILDSEVSVSVKDSKKNKNKPPKSVTDISKIDLANMDKDDLRKLRGKIGVELFKREHNLSDAVYDFYKMNKDMVTIEEAKKICEEHNGSVDLFLLKKREVRKKVEKKLHTT